MSGHESSDGVMNGSLTARSGKSSHGLLNGGETSCQMNGEGGPTCKVAFGNSNMRSEEHKSRTGMKPGQDLVIAGYIGLCGTAVIAGEKETELLTRLSGQFVYRCKNIFLNQCVPERHICEEAGATEYEPSGEGGIMNTLWTLFDEYRLGFEIQLRALPIRQETVEVCEVFDVNPYRLRSDGCVVLAAENGGDLVRWLREKEIHAAVIGKVKAGIKRRILNGETESFLDRPKPDELYKII